MPQNIIQGVKVDGVIYKYDYESLENLPGPELPGYSESADDGKVLSVSYGSGLVWLHPGEKLPQYGNGDEGNVLTVGNNGNYLYWEDPVDPFPEYDYSDQGKLLAVANEGLEWTDYPLPEYSHSDMGKLLAVANTGLEWIESPTSIPNYDAGDSGKTIMVNDTGNDIVWRSPLPDHANQTNAYLQLNDYGEVEWGSLPLPSYNSGTEGRYLGVDEYGDLQWLDILPDGSGGMFLRLNENRTPVWGDGEIPEYSDENDGDTLVVCVGDCGEAHLEWKDILPSWSANDTGKVLTIGQNGELSWQMPS